MGWPTDEHTIPKGLVQYKQSINNYPSSYPISNTATYRCGGLGLIAVAGRLTGIMILMKLSRERMRAVTVWSTEGQFCSYTAGLLYKVDDCHYCWKGQTIASSCRFPGHGCQQ